MKTKKYKYQIEKVESFSRWDNFLKDSPQGTIFSSSFYLKAAVKNFELLWIKKGNEIKAGLCLTLDDTRINTKLDDLVIHNGLIFAPAGEHKSTKARSSRFEITEFVIEWLENNFQTIELALSPQFEDLRPFLWYNYHSKDPKEKFVLDLRYTSYLDIGSLQECKNDLESPLFQGLETLRQRNIREARKMGSYTRIEGDGESFVGYYAELMKAQGQIQSNYKIQRLKAVIDTLIQMKKGLMFTTFNLQGLPIYSTVFGWDSKRAYYLFGAPVPNMNERYKGTIAFWDAFKYLASKKIKTVDLEGVNSPKRGWFKLGFNGDLRRYYEVYKK